MAAINPHTKLELPGVVDDRRAKSARRSTTGHELIKDIDTLHLSHETEGESGDDLIGVRCVLHNRLVEVPDLTLAALLTVVLIGSVEVLT